MDLCGELKMLAFTFHGQLGCPQGGREQLLSPLGSHRDGTGHTLCCRAAAASHQFAGREKKQRQSRASAAGRETQLPAISWRLNPSISAHLGPGGLRC